MIRESRHSSHLLMPSRRPIMASDKVWGRHSRKRVGFSRSIVVFNPRKLLTNGIRDANLSPGPSVYLCHQVDIHKDAHQWEDRHSRDLWAKSVHP